jgi:hypothetical protein
MEKTTIKTVVHTESRFSIGIEISRIRAGSLGRDDLLSDLSDEFDQPKCKRFTFCMVCSNRQETASMPFLRLCHCFERIPHMHTDPIR